MMRTAAKTRTLLVEHAKAAETREDWGAAAKLWRQALDLGDASTPASLFFKLSRAYRQLGELEEAERITHEGLERYPSDERLLVEHGAIAGAREDWGTAAKLWRQALDLGDASTPASLFFKLSRAYRQLGELEEAERITQEGLERYPSDERLLVEHGAIAGAREDWGTAAKLWRQALDLGDASTPVSLFVRLSWVYCQLGELEEAERITHEGLERYPSDERLKVARAVNHIRGQNDFEYAEEIVDVIAGEDRDSLLLAMLRWKIRGGDAEEWCRLRIERLLEKPGPATATCYLLLEGLLPFANSRHQRLKLSAFQRDCQLAIENLPSGRIRQRLEKLKQLLRINRLNSAQVLAGKENEPGTILGSSRTIQFMIQDSLIGKEIFEAIEYNHEHAYTRLKGVKEGQVIDIDPITKGDNTVEIQLPVHVIYHQRPWQSKRFREQETLRRFYRDFISELLEHRVIVVPVYQIQQHNVASKTPFPAISYHTNSTSNTAWHVKEAALPEYLTVDEGGYSGWVSWVADPTLLVPLLQNVDGAQCRRFCTELRGRIFSGNISKYEQPVGGGNEITGSYVFIPMQIPTDCVGQLAVIEPFNFVNMIVEYYSRKGVKVVIKRHPLCRDTRVGDFLTQLSEVDNVIISQSSIHDLIRGAEVIFTINSSVGLEALIHGKPVVCAGLSDYLGGASLVKNRDDLNSVLDNDAFVSSVDVEKFIYTYFNTLLVKKGDKTALKKIALKIQNSLDPKNNSSLQLVS